MSDFVKELNFDGDTFNDMKRDMNFVLQRLLGNMQEKECQEGTLTLKLDVSLVREYVPNYIRTFLERAERLRSRSSATR